MSNIKLDLSKFKHVKSDDKSTTLKHYEGHELTLAHNKLSKANREQLKAMANLAKGNEKTTDKSEAKQDQQMKQPQEEPIKFAEGTPDEVIHPTDTIQQPGEDQTRIYPPSASINDTLSADLTNAGINNIKELDQSKSINLPDTAGVYSLPDSSVQPATVSELQKQKANYKEMHPNEVMPETNQAEAPVAMPSGLEQSAAQSQAAIAQATAPETTNTDPYLNSLAQSQAAMNKADLASAAALQAQGNAEKLALDKAVEARKTAADLFKEKTDFLQQQGEAIKHDIENGYIDPNKYWTGYKLPNGNYVDGHSKIASVIGMLVAGFGGNNAAKMLDDQINQSIDAQKANLNSSHNLLKANLEQFKNYNDAYTATRMQLNDDVINRLQAAAATAKGPLAKAAADMEIAKRMQQQNILANSIVASQSFAKLAQGAPSLSPDHLTSAAHEIVNRLAVTDPEKAKAFSNRIVDGVGVSSKLEGVNEATRQQLLAQQKLNNAGYDLLDYAKKHNNILPIGADYNTGVTKALAFQQAVREGMLGTVFRESEKPLLEKFVTDNPSGAFKQITTEPRLKSILESNRINFETTKQAAGIAPTPIRQPSSMEGKTIVDKQGNRQIFQNGKWTPIK
jgi:hypothetical protein